MIKVEGATVSVGGVNTLSNISLTLGEPELVVALGPNGAGKSTLLNCLSGEREPASGHVSFFGRRIEEWSLESLATRLAVLPQSSELNFPFLVEEVVALGRYPHSTGKDADKEIVRRAIEQVDALHLVGRNYASLSGGEKQRVCIARALAARPDLIICDEPTSALDQLVAEGILRLLQELQKELKVSYLFITHDLATVKAISDEMVVMLKGRIVEQGLKEKVLAPPHHEYTDLLLSSVPEMDPNWLDQLMERRARDGVMQSTSTS